jgi:cytidylate kinase
MPPPERLPPPVITISASYGAGGSLIGPQIAQRLSVPFVDRAIPVEVSSRLAVSVDDALAHEELPQRTLSRMMPFFGSALQIFTAAPLHPEVLEHHGHTFRQTTEQVLRECAARGAVILGRAAVVVLGDVEHALHVRLDGPRERRVRQAMRLQGLDRATAQAQLVAADLSREAYVRHWYRVEPQDAGLYHLVIDSTAIELDACVELLARALQSRVTQP